MTFKKGSIASCENQEMKVFAWQMLGEDFLFNPQNEG
jgi:hypothetical protein